MSEKKHANLSAALAAAQGQISHVEKADTFRGEKFSYKYAASEDIIDEARKALSDNGLAFSAVSATYVPGSAETRTPALVTLRYCLDHESGGQRFYDSQTPVLPSPGRPEDKALAAAKTYDLGYTLRSLLLIPRGDGPDGVNQRTDAPPQAAKPAPQKKTKPEPSPYAKAATVAAQAQVVAAIEDAKGRGVPEQDVQAECKRFWAANGGRPAVMSSSELMGQLVGVLDDLGAKVENEETPWNKK